MVAPCRPELVLTVLDGLDIRIPHNISSFLYGQRHAHFLECRYRDARNFLQVSYNREPFYIKPNVFPFSFLLVFVSVMLFIWSFI